MRRWNPGLLYFSLKAINPHKSALPTNPAAPAALDKWSVLYQAPKRYKDAFTLWWFLEGVTSAELNQWFPWLSKDNWERAPKRGGISAGWIPAAPDCACPFSRALGELYLPWCSLQTPGCETRVTAECQVCPEALVPGLDSAGLQWDTLSAFLILTGESPCLPASHALAYFLHTLLTLAYGILSPKMCLYFFFQAYQLFSPGMPPNSVCFVSVSFGHNSVTWTSVTLLFDHNLSNNRALLTLASS